MTKNRTKQKQPACSLTPSCQNKPILLILTRILPWSRLLKPCGGMNYIHSYSFGDMFSDYVAGAQNPLRFGLGASDLDYFADESALATCHYCSRPVNKMCYSPGCWNWRHRQTTKWQTLSITSQSAVSGADRPKQGRCVTWLHVERNEGNYRLKDCYPSVVNPY